ncbi:MAG: hypothetical protein A2512_04745 [Deltaproteobacteria bacterium RIFOXYD12_FULL_56_24]|nr:MAG: hypothetical protein A2512_04745 [Deltaproteobacteria bacterium RIFOXYD12_FULL_56_24]
MSLFDLLIQEREQRAASAPARLNVVAALHAAIREAIRQAPKSRETIAEEMTALAGQPISVHQVNNWTADSHPHRIPAELLPAFCQATGSIEPLRLLAEAAGVFTLPGPDALRAEIQKLDEEARHITREKRKRELFLKEMEK